MRVLTLVLASLLALSAIPVGAMLVAVPDGTLLGASTEWIRGLPFSTYLPPGLILAGVVGGSAAAAWVLTFRRARLAPLATALCGVIVMVWIAVQVATVNRFSPLQPIAFAVGVTLALLGAAAGARWWLRWVAANAGAELLGLGAVAIAFVAAAPLFARARFVAAAVAVVVGAFEGLVVGAAQAATLRAVLPRLSSRAWIAATVLGGVSAWILGMIPSVLMHRGGDAAPPVIDDRVQMLLAAGLGAVAGPILAAFQVRELGRHVRRAGWWLVANAVAWALGMPLIFAAASGAPAARAVVLIAAAGAVVGATHGLALVALLRAPAQARAGFSGPTSTEYGGGTSTSDA